MATHSNILAWRIPGTEEPGGLPSVGSHRVGLKRRSSSTSNRYAYDTTLMAESEEELKSLLMKVKEESEKADLKLNILKANIKASSPIISWQINGKTMETVRDFIFEVPKSLQILTAAMKLKDTCSLK